VASAKKKPEDSPPVVPTEKFEVIQNPTTADASTSTDEPKGDPCEDESKAPPETSTWDIVDE